MDRHTRTSFENLRSKEGNVRFEALTCVLEATNSRVDWAYDVWDEMVERLRDKDNHQRAIAAQVLCNLAKSDPAGRILKDFDALLAVTRDERFVTARHCLQSLWKIGAAGEKQRIMVVDGLAGRFKECIAEKNCTLIRYDIIEGLRKLYDEVKDEEVKRRALGLIETEEDGKCRKKIRSPLEA